MFRQLHKKLVRWTTFHTKMLRGMVKIDVKKDVCHFELVIKVLILNIYIYIYIERKNEQSTNTNKARAY